MGDRPGLRMRSARCLLRHASVATLGDKSPFGLLTGAARLLAKATVTVYIMSHGHRSVSGLGTCSPYFLGVEIKIVTTGSQILKLKFTQFDFGCDTAGGAYHAYSGLLPGFKGTYF